MCKYPCFHIGYQLFGLCLELVLVLVVIAFGIMCSFWDQLCQASHLCTILFDQGLLVLHVWQICCTMQVRSIYLSFSEPVQNTCCNTYKSFSFCNFRGFQTLSEAFRSFKRFSEVFISFTEWRNLQLQRHLTLLLCQASPANIAIMLMWVVTHVGLQF